MQKEERLLVKGNEMRKETRQIRDSRVKVITYSSLYNKDIYQETFCALMQYLF